MEINWSTGGNKLEKLARTIFVIGVCWCDGQNGETSVSTYLRWTEEQATFYNVK